MSFVLTLRRHFSMMMKDSASYLMPCVMWINHLRQGPSSDVLSPWKCPHFSKSFLKFNWADCERSTNSVPFPYACPNTCAIKTCRTKGQLCACTSYKHVCMCIQACQAIVQCPVSPVTRCMISLQAQVSSNKQRIVLVSVCFRLKTGKSN